jgi:sulfide:quinone oxidoreductase
MSSKNHFQILVIGGGNAGLSVASKLLIKDKKLDIGIIEPSEKHYYQPAWTLVGAGTFNHADTEKNEKDFIPKKAKWIKDAASSFDPAHNTVTCTSGQVYSYNILIVVPGIQLDWKKISGLKDTLGKHAVTSNYQFSTAPYTWELIKNFKGGTAIFTNPPTPVKCGGAPHKIMWLACDYWRKQGILHKCDVRFISGGSILFGVPEYRVTLEEKAKEYGVKIELKQTILSVNGPDRTLTYKSNENNPDEKAKTVHFDLLHIVPPQSAPDFVKSSALADASTPLGWVEVNPETFQHTRFPNVFSCGDVCSAPTSRTGAAIRKEAPVMVSHIMAFLNNTTSNAKYDGYSACPIPTSYGKLMLAEFDYTNKPTMTFPFDQAKPRRSMWILKKHILPWLYWNKILQGKA